MTRRFVLPFVNEADRLDHMGYFLPKVEIEDCNVMTDGRNFLIILSEKN